MEMDRYLKATPLLDYTHPRIAALASKHKWCALETEEKIARAYTHVRDAVPFGYNCSDDLPASASATPGRLC